MTDSVPFDSSRLFETLSGLDADGLDRLDFGVVVMAPDGTVTGYNTYESRLSGLSKDRVIGRHFFSAVAPCTNNFMVSHRFESECPLDDTIDYVFTLRMKPRKVRLRLLRAPDAPSMFLVVREA